jgi:hypothetical protein
MNRKDTLKWFAGKMMERLDQNTYKVHWRFMPQSFLLGKLNEQFPKLDKGIKEKDHTEIIRRCANIANYTMMIADNERRLWEK